MEIEEIQNQIMKIAEEISKKNNCSLMAEISFMHITEEVGEIAREFVNQKIRQEKFDKEKMKEGVCNIILESLVFAKILNMDISEEIKSKMNQLSHRYNLN